MLMDILEDGEVVDSEEESAKLRLSKSDGGKNKSLKANLRVLSLRHEIEKKRKVNHIAASCELPSDKIEDTPSEDHSSRLDDSLRREVKVDSQEMAVCNKPTDSTTDGGKTSEQSKVSADSLDPGPADDVDSSSLPPVKVKILTMDEFVTRSEELLAEEETYQENVTDKRQRKRKADEWKQMQALGAESEDISMEPISTDCQFTGMDDEDGFDLDVEALLEGRDEEKELTGKDEKLEYEERDKVVLIDRHRSPLQILPPGWTELTHSSGMPLYFHKLSRVITWSRPYSVTSETKLRTHEVPSFAIPCYHYRKAKLLESEEQQLEQKVAEIKARAPPESIPLSVSEVGDNYSEPCDSNVTETLQNADAGVEGNSLQLKTTQQLQGSSISASDLHLYCTKLFDFKNLTIKRFKSWSERRKFMRTQKKKTDLEKLKPSTDPNAKLLTFEIPIPWAPTRNRLVMINPKQETPTSLLHKYVHLTMKVVPHYDFISNYTTSQSYCCRVFIKDIEYGQGLGSNKKQAKYKAAEQAIAVLIPKISHDHEGDKEQDDICTVFDDLDVTDSRISKISSRLGRPSPVEILHECLRRNTGILENDITEVSDVVNISVEGSNRFTMTVGRFVATVQSNNKKEGRQLAAQHILREMHPRVERWGSLIRLYGQERHRVNAQQNKLQLEEIAKAANESDSTSKGPNNAILEKLRNDMLALHREKASCPVAGRLEWDARLLLKERTL